MRLWCIKNKYLIFSRVNQGLKSIHSFQDCFNCNEQECEFPLHIRKLPPAAISLFMNWLADSPADIILYHFKLNILTREQLNESEWKIAKLLYSFPPELSEHYWTAYFRDKSIGKDMKTWGTQEKIKEIIQIIELSFEGWDPNKPYWENNELKRRNL